VISHPPFIVGDPARHLAHRAGLWRTDGSPLRLLLVDHESLVRDIVSTALRYEGCEVTTAGEGDAALAASRRIHPDAVILGTRLPDMSGIHVLNLLRGLRPDLPTLLLTRNAADRPGIMSANGGGDDWLTKPFSLEDLLLKLRTLLRRRGVSLMHRASEITVGDLVLSDDSRSVMRSGASIRLSCREFELLRFLMRNSERVVTKPQILGRVWPYAFTGRLSVVELYVSYLRRKIDVGRAPMIHTLRRTGYILKVPTDA